MTTGYALIHRIYDGQTHRVLGEDYMLRGVARDAALVEFADLVTRDRGMFTPRRCGCRLVGGRSHTHHLRVTAESDA